MWRNLPFPPVILSVQRRFFDFPWACWVSEALFLSSLTFRTPIFARSFLSDFRKHAARLPFASMLFLSCGGPLLHPPRSFSPTSSSVCGGIEMATFFRRCLFFGYTLSSVPVSHLPAQFGFPLPPKDAAPLELFPKAFRLPLPVYFYLMSSVVTFPCPSASLPFRWKTLLLIIF